MQFQRSEEKNKQLLQERGICFEDVQVCVDENTIVDIVDHHNQKTYAHQNIILINWHDYVYAVPFVIQSDGSYFLKTIYPSRNYTKLYLGK